MMKGLVNAMAKAIVDAANSQPKYIVVENKEGTRKRKMYPLAVAVNTMSKKKFHDMVLGGYNAFKERCLFIEMPNLDDKDINRMYNDLSTREDGDTTVIVTLSARWKWEYKKYEFKGYINFFLSHSNDAMVPRFELEFCNPVTEKYMEFKDYFDLREELDKVVEELTRIESWISAWKKVEEEKYQYHLTPVNCTKHEINDAI